jgi:tRNA (guanine37-N1)-methyltransferase
MKINILTLFPEMFEPLRQSMLGRAIDNGILELDVTDIRDYTTDKHNRVDDTPYGGGAGMVMQVQPILDACEGAGYGGEVIYMSPRGEMLDGAVAEELSKKEEITILCGHYEGVDERVLEAIVDEQISIGDYVLTGGEIPAMALVDCVSRMVPGVPSDDVCFTDESHFAGLLEYPQYTRPAEWEGRAVPEILLSGHHANIARWRHEQSLERTHRLRPDLLESAPLTDADRAYLAQLTAEETADGESI